MQVKDRGKSLNVVIIGSPNVNPGYQLVANQDYPEIAADYAKTFRLLKSLPGSKVCPAAKGPEHQSVCRPRGLSGLRG